MAHGDPLPDACWVRMEGLQLTETSSLAAAGLTWSRAAATNGCLSCLSRSVDKGLHRDTCRSAQDTPQPSGSSTPAQRYAATPSQSDKVLHRDACRSAQDTSKQSGSSTPAQRYAATPSQSDKVLHRDTCRSAQDTSKQSGSSTPAQRYAATPSQSEGGVLSERSDNFSSGTRAKANAILDQARLYAFNRDTSSWEKDIVMC